MVNLVGESFSIIVKDKGGDSRKSSSISLYISHIHRINLYKALWYLTWGRSYNNLSVLLLYLRQYLTKWFIFCLFPVGYPAHIFILKNSNIHIIIWLCDTIYLIIPDIFQQVYHQDCHFKSSEEPTVDPNAIPPYPPKWNYAK